MSKGVNLFVRKLGGGTKKLTLTFKPHEQPLKKEGDVKKVVPLKLGIEIPESMSVETKDDFLEEDIRNTNLKYPLTEIEGTVYAYAHIFYDKKINEVVYNVIEPEIDEKTRILIEEIKEYIQEKIDINFSQVRKKEAYKYIEKFLDKAIVYFKKKYTADSRGVLRYYIIRDFIGLGRLEPFMNDSKIEDISCDGTGINLYVYHRNPKLGSLKTNIKFKSKDELDSFVNKLAERCGRTISVSKPLLDGTLPNGSRVQITLSSDIAMRGSNFTIRMFTREPMTPVDLLNYATVDIKMLGYLWFLIGHGNSFLVSGGTASGKTSLLNGLSLFIKPQMKIVSIEDTAELRLPHSHWLPEVARTSIARHEGEVDMFELLRESLRQRPDYIIVGEVRGKEAYVLFQQMAIGHSGMSTIHAESMKKLTDRLTSPPISLPPALLQSLDVVIFIKRVRIGRRYMRRIQSVAEVIGMDEKTGNPITNEIFRWDPKKDRYEIVSKSRLLKKISDTSSMAENEVKDELKKRYRILKWMFDRNIHDYKKIGYVLNLYYASPDALLNRLEASL